LDSRHKCDSIIDLDSLSLIDGTEYYFLTCVTHSFERSVD